MSFSGCRFLNKSNSALHAFHCHCGLSSCELKIGLLLNVFAQDGHKNKFPAKNLPAIHATQQTFGCWPYMTIVQPVANKECQRTWVVRNFFFYQLFYLLVVYFKLYCIQNVHNCISI